MANFKDIWLICSIFHKSVDEVEFTISQEGYARLEDAIAFCEGRNNGQVYDIDKFTYVSEPNEKGSYYEYKIMCITVKGA